jgi:hypothetical protein
MSAAIIASAATYRGFGYLGPREGWLSRPTYIARPLLELKVGGPRAGFRMPSIPRSCSHAACVKAGSAPTMSRSMFQAAMFRAPSGGGPMASETEQGGQKQMRCDADFWRGRTPTVCANM